MTIFLIFPMQLYNSIDELDNVNAKHIYLVEDPLYFTKYKYHKLTIAYRRAAFKSYSDFLTSRGYKHTYVDFYQVRDFYIKLFDSDDEIYAWDPVDSHMVDLLDRLDAHLLDSPAFLTTEKQIHDFYSDGKSYIHDTSWYRWQRRRLDVLMKTRDKKSVPEGKWTYDKQNRARFPNDIVEPVKYRQIKRADKFVKEAIKYTNKHFEKNPGELGDEIIYPIDHNSAKAHFLIFMKNKISDFGKYQDAISRDIVFGYHSVISCVLNNGLLSPKFVLDNVLLWYKGLSTLRKSKVINSVEGFLRQVIGWREYVRALYILEGAKQRKMNHFGGSAELTKHWWDGTTGVEPLDFVIKKINKYAYAHHIERLMVVGNMMLLCKIHPHAVFEWFISYCSIDAYDWVMVPNIYGMSQYSDGGLMMTRPYMSTSNYIKNISDFRGEWDEIWDTLYYNFISANAKKLESLYSTALSVKYYKAKSAQEKRTIKKQAREFLARVTK